MRLEIDLNCDLGEGEPAAQTRELMRWINSANVACGGHAGDLRSMARCVRLCREFDVQLGAHPGPWSRHDFGRLPVSVTPDELELLLVQQVGALERVAQEARVPLHHVKLHGALYHATEVSLSLARCYLATVQRFWPHLVVFARAGGRVSRLATREKMVVWEEGFLDRHYLDDGTLVPRTDARALLLERGAISQRLQDLAAGGGLSSVSGQRLKLRPRTVCLHADTDNALVLARTAGQILRRHRT